MKYGVVTASQSGLPRVRRIFDMLLRKSKTALRTMDGPPVSWLRLVDDRLGDRRAWASEKRVILPGFEGLKTNREMIKYRAELRSIRRSTLLLRTLTRRKVFAAVYIWSTGYSVEKAVRDAEGHRKLANAYTIYITNSYRKDNSGALWYEKESLFEPKVWRAHTGINLAEAAQLLHIYLLSTLNTICHS